jgi:hypothetical protein
MLSISSAVTTKPYDGDMLIKGGIKIIFNGIIDADDGLVLADSLVLPDSIEALYTSPNALTKTVNIFSITLTGERSINYIITSLPVYNVPVLDGITKAPGAPVGAPTLDIFTANSIRINPVNPPANGQTVEYAIRDGAWTSNWQDGLIFTGSFAGREIIILARSKENNNYDAGDPSFSSNPIRMFTIAFSANGATGMVPAQLVLDGMPITIPGAGSLVRSGYVFDGWNTNPQGTGTNYQPGQSYIVNAGQFYIVNATVTLYAKWL